MWGGREATAAEVGGVTGVAGLGPDVAARQRRGGSTEGRPWARGGARMLVPLALAVGVGGVMSWWASGGGHRLQLTEGQALAIDVAVALVLILVSVLLVGRILRDARLDDLLLAAGSTVLAIALLVMHVALPVAGVSTARVTGEWYAMLFLARRCW